MSHVNNDMADWFDLDAYFSGASDPRGRADVEQWFHATPERQVQLRRLHMLWLARQYQPTRDYRRDEAIAQVLATIGERSLPKVRPSIATPLQPRASRPWYAGRVGRAVTWGALTGALAAAVIGVVVIRPTWLMTHRPGSHLIMYTTEKGQRANITLPDGSMVTLNVASQLGVPSDYEAGNHTLQLRGQASFSVPHQSTTPLIVEAGDVATRVLGTQFMVRRYGTDPATTVAVRVGRVAVGMPGTRGVVLSADQQTVASAHQALQVIPGDLTQFDFETGTLVLNGVSLHDAIPDLNRWYNIDVQLTDHSIDLLRLSSRLISNDPAHLITALESTFPNVRVERHGDTITVSPR